jgi:hypothetical protein
MEEYASNVVDRASMNEFTQELNFCYIFTNEKSALIESVAVERLRTYRLLPYPFCR